MISCAGHQGKSTIKLNYKFSSVISSMVSSQVEAVTLIKFVSLFRIQCPDFDLNEGMYYDCGIASLGCTS